MTDNALEIKDLTKMFGSVKALDNVSFRVNASEMVGVIGRSGAGKSTLLRHINRLVDPTRGSIIFHGQDILALKGQYLRNWRKDCAMIFQQFNLVERLNVMTNVLIGRLANHGFLSSMAMRFTDHERAMAIQALERLDLLPQALIRAGDLSGGQQQRVAIARALVQEPRVMLADEPIASLDPENATRVMKSLRQINQEDGITVLVNLHTLDTARTYCDRIIAMRDGRVKFIGTGAELSNDVVREIYELDSIADFDEAVTKTSVDV